MTAEGVGGGEELTGALVDRFEAVLGGEAERFQRQPAGVVEVARPHVGRGQIEAAERLRTAQLRRVERREAAVRWSMTPVASPRTR